MHWPPSHKDGDGELTKHEFITGMRRLIFSNDFQRQCLVGLSIAQQKRKMFELRLEMEGAFIKVTDKLDALLAHASGQTPPITEVPLSQQPLPPSDPAPHTQTLREI